MNAGADLRRALGRLDPTDPIRALIELVVEDDDPALAAGVVRRLLAEIRIERGQGEGNATRAVD